MRSGGGESSCAFRKGKELVEISYVNVLSLAFGLTLFFLSYHPGDGMCVCIYVFTCKICLVKDVVSQDFHGNYGLPFKSSNSLGFFLVVLHMSF